MLPQADDLEALKAQIEALNARVAAMEAAPTAPAGYQLLAISEGDRVNIPGLEKVNTISVLPTADAPAGATITWTGFVRAGLVWQSGETSGNVEYRSNESASWSQTGEDFDGDSDDLDVFAPPTSP